jgi:hypothetical protein
LDMRCGPWPSGAALVNGQGAHPTTLT